MEGVATPTEIKMWPVIIGAIGVLLAAVGLLIGLPIAASRFDDPARLLWLLTVPVLVAFAVLGLVLEPVRVTVRDSGIIVKWVNRTRTINRADIVGFVTPKLLGEDILVMLSNGTKVELPNSEDRVLTALRHHFPDVPITRSDTEYLSA